MGAPYSEKVRKSVVEYLDAGNSQLKAARHFGLSRGTIFNYKKLSEKGSLKAKPTGGKRPKKFEDEDLKKLLKKNPSMTQEELGRELNVSHTAIYKRLSKMNITYKKNATLYRTKTVR